MISAQLVKELREKTGVSMIECKKALEEAEGDLDRALEVLKSRSQAQAAKKSDRELGAGTVASYIHSNGQVGALVVLSSETDFVSKNEEFTTLARDIAMHAAAMHAASIEELLPQQFIKDPSLTISDLITGAIQKFGERIEVSQLAVFSL